jgi:predicted aldo/keto reductase-like oxidoreductase
LLGESQNLAVDERPILEFLHFLGPTMHSFFTFRQGLPPVRRLGLATRGNTHLTQDDVLVALHAGINYWNWSGHEDGMVSAARELGSRRRQVMIAIQLESRDKAGARRELEENLDRLKTSYIDVVTFYYVEHREEWHEIIGDQGALAAVRTLKEQGVVHLIGLTTHQRSLGVEVLRSRELDLLMARYNAAHRAAETTLFPIAQECQAPVVTFTSLRWKGLLQSTPEDPPNFSPPRAPDWYRLVLSNPAVAVALMAPNDRDELLQNLSLLADWRPLTTQESEALYAHGERVRRNAGRFP